MTGADERPVFVLGNPRSGTTLLRLMLTSHPEVCIPPEAGFAVWLERDYGGWGPTDGYDGFLTDLMETRKFHHWRLSKPRLGAWLAESDPEDYGALVASVYRCYLSQVCPEATIWGDKNNFHVGEIPAIKRLFPRSVLIHIVRDGRNVAASYRALRDRDLESAYAPQLPQGIEAIATEWSASVGTVERSLRDLEGDDSLTIRMEDLQDTPETVLAGVCGLIGIRFDEVMLRYHELSEETGGEPEEFSGWKAKNRQPVLASDRERFRRELSGDEIAAFEKVAGEMLRRFGYPVGPA